jgi:diacylglycerol kinase (ATP)
MRTVAIVNPVSGRGKATLAWDKVRGHLGGSVETLQTNRPQHASELVSAAIRNGAQMIIAVGGDGTINEVLNGFFDRETLISDTAILAILPHGTGADLQRLLQIPEDDHKAATFIQSGRPRPVDVLKVRYTNSEGDWACRYCLNVTSFGMGGIVASRVRQFSAICGGKLGFVLATIRTAMTFSGNPVQMCIDDSVNLDVGVANVAVGNGRYHGAGMLVCPRAEIDDGFLDVTVIRHMSIVELGRNLSLLYNGKIYTHPKVQFFRATSIRAVSTQATLIEIDGEPLGRLPIEITVLPRAIRLLA